MKKHQLVVEPNSSKRSICFDHASPCQACYAVKNKGQLVRPTAQIRAKGVEVFQVQQLAERFEELLYFPTLLGDPARDANLSDKSSIAFVALISMHLLSWLCQLSYTDSCYSIWLRLIALHGF